MTTKKQNAYQYIRRTIKNQLDKRKTNSLGFIPYFVQLLFIFLTAFLTWAITSPASVDSIQNKYAEEKIAAYISLTRMLRDGRNPHGPDPEKDILPVHRDSAAFAKWWRDVDNFYQENVMLFDDSSRILYHQLNQLTLVHQETLNSNPFATIKYRHDLKQPLADRVRELDDWFREYLDEKYGTERGMFFWQ